MAASSSKKASVPEAKEAMSRFKEEVASELGVPLKEGYNGDLTSKQAGSIGGEASNVRFKCKHKKRPRTMGLVCDLFCYNTGACRSSIPAPVEYALLWHRL